MSKKNNSGWVTAASVGAGLAAVAAGIGWWVANRSPEPEANTSSQNNNSNEDNLRNIRKSLSRLTVSPDARFQGYGINEDSIPQNPIITNLDSLLHDIYVRHIALKKYDFSHHYKVFDEVFLKIHRTMKAVDTYYENFSSTVQVAGSHFDRLRIKKPDEFDIDIHIRLPLNMKPDRANPNNSDIILESMTAGYVKLKMGTQFQNLPYRDRWDINRKLYSWKDDDSYLLRSKFSYWFKSLVNRAINEFESFGNNKMCYVDGKPYIVKASEEGPALTLKINCMTTDFKMSVDLVPVLTFPVERWPTWDGYRPVPARYHHDNFMVVPKPIKGDSINSGKSWRMSLIHQENKMFYNTLNLRLTIKLLKKLRDTLEMHYIASYYVKTLFFWEQLERDDPEFWRQAPSVLFTMMVKKLHAALSRKRIPYFWNDQYNLIEHAPSNIVAGHVAKLAKLIKILDNPSEYKKVAEFLLTYSEYREYVKFLY